jgi:hypothetical protein
MPIRMRRPREWAPGQRNLAVPPQLSTSPRRRKAMDPGTRRGLSLKDSCGSIGSSGLLNCPGPIRCHPGCMCGRSGNRRSRQGLLHGCLKLRCSRSSRPRSKRPHPGARHIPGSVGTEQKGDKSAVFGPRPHCSHAQASRSRNSLERDGQTRHSFQLTRRVHGKGAHSTDQRTQSHHPTNACSSWRQPSRETAALTRPSSSRSTQETPTCCWGTKS